MIGTDIGNAARQISELKNPFSADKLIEFNTFCYISFGKWQYTGSIEFKNGNTKGCQDFEADNFASLLKKMEAFMAELGGEK